jgi:hypothetical protein
MVYWRVKITFLVNPFIHVLERKNKYSGRGSDMIIIFLSRKIIPHI